MVYILHQRLRAQSVQFEKEKKVLRDVVMAMFSPLFIEELFKPQAMYSSLSTKQIFEKLAHSSIMRLNKSSMDKLYDLMTMGLKYQLVSSNCPQQFLQVTLNHMQSMRQLVGLESAGVRDCIQRAEDMLQKTYNEDNFTAGDWLVLKQSLFRFVQGKKIKVSLFLQRKIQTVDGTLVLNHTGMLPFGVERPGIVRTFDGSSGAFVRQFEQPTIANQGCVEATTIWNPDLVLGINMYSAGTLTFCSEDIAKDAKAKEDVLATLRNMISRMSFGGVEGDATYGQGGGAGGKDARRLGNHGISARAESKMNAALFGSGSSHKAPSSSESGGGEGGGGGGGDGLQMRLHSLLSNNSTYKQSNGGDFDDGGKGSAGGGDFDGGGGGGFLNIYIEEIDCAADAKTMASMIASLDLDDSADDHIGSRTNNSKINKDDKKAQSKAAPLVDDDEDDLLALMDGAK